MGYNPNWDVDLREGEISEEAVKAGCSGTVEVKRQARVLHFGLVFVEVQQRPRRGGAWKPSGLSTSTADHWAFQLGANGRDIMSTLWIATDELRGIVDELAYEQGYREPVHNDVQGRGVVVPLTRLLGLDHDTAPRRAA